MPDPLKDEEWRRMHFTGLDLMNRPAAGKDVLLLATDGKPVPPGVTFGTLEEVTRTRPDLVREHFATRVLPASRGKFEALSAALFGAGAVIHVPKNVHVEGTLVLQWRGGGIPEAPGAAFGVFRRNLIILEEGATASVLCLDESHDPAVPGLAVAATEIVLGQGARLRHGTIQVAGGGVWSFDTRRALVGRDARMEWVSCDLGAKVARNTIESSLSEAGGRAQARSMIFGSGRQFTDLGVRMLHAAPHTESDMLVRAALTDSARSVYRGHVDIKRGSRGTNSQQKEAVLLLSPDARSDAIPSLFIDENDLKAGHGATAGRVDERALFYLMSRGLPRKMAERLIIEGFFMPLLEQIPMEKLREELLQRIDKKIGA